MSFFIDERPLNDTMLSSTAMTLDVCILFSGGYSEHRLPAEISEDGRGQLHPLALHLYCKCNEYFQSVS
jgi:hypothetical protein